MSGLDAAQISGWGIVPGERYRFAARDPSAPASRAQRAACPARP